MNPEWLCYVGGQEYGPYTWPQLVQMAQAGNVVPQTHVRRNFDSQWYLAEQVPGLFPAPASTNPKTAAHPAAPAKTASGTKKAMSKSGTQPALSKSGTQPALKATPKAAPAAAPVLPEPATAPTAIAATPAVAAPVVASVPKGRVIAKAPATATPAASRPIPLQQQAAQNPGTHFVAPKVAVAASSETDGASLPARKGNNSKQLVLYLGGAIVGVAIVGGLALIYKFTRPPEPPPEVAAPVVIPTNEKDPNVIAEEVNPAEETNPANMPKPAGAKNAAKPDAKSDATKAKSNEAAGASAATTTLVRAVAQWRPIEKFGKVGMRDGLTVTKMVAYLAADASGRKVAVRSTGGAPPAAEGAPVDNGATATVAPNADANATGTPAIIAPTPAPAGPVKYVAAEAAPFLFVELTISNHKDGKPMTYAGWNNGDTAAVLVDAAGKEFKLIPASQTPGASRQKATEVKPGESIQDTLVFEVPPNSDLQFRIVLPPIAFSPKLKGAWGYEIGGNYLAAAVTAQAPATLGPDGKPLPPGVHSSGRIAIPGLEPTAPPMPQATPATAPAQPAGEPEMKKEEKPAPPTSRIPIPGLEEDPKPAAPKKPDEVPNLAPPAKKK